MKDCEYVSVELTTTSSDWGVFMEGDAPIRLNEVGSAFMLHVINDSGISDLDCPFLDIKRVIQCPIGCAVDEFSWSMPCQETTSYLLPRGVYDINVCKQSAFPLEEGETITYKFLIERVDKEFVSTYLGLL